MVNLSTNHIVPVYRFTISTTIPKKFEGVLPVPGALHEVHTVA